MDIIKLCLDQGAFKAEEIPVTSLVFAPELRKLCEDNRCGRFGRNYTCPPFSGEVDMLINKLKTFSKAVIWQNVYHLEDSFDFEGMINAQREHNEQVLNISKQIYKNIDRDKCVVLAAGGCTLCETCAAVTGEPCRDAENAFSSLEAYGIFVSKIESVSGLKYINGEDTVTYFAGAFL